MEEANWILGVLLSERIFTVLFEFLLLQVCHQ